MVELAHSLSTAVKAFQLEASTALVILPAYRDDPHPLFAGGLAGPITDAADAMVCGKVLDAFMADCAAAPDPSCTSATLADNLVMTIHGDTPKDPLTPSGWPDNTPGNSNWIYVYGGGYLKTRWVRRASTPQTRHRVGSGHEERRAWAGELRHRAGGCGCRGVRRRQSQGRHEARARTSTEVGRSPRVINASPDVMAR